MAALNASWFAAVMGTAGTAAVAAMNPSGAAITETASRVLALVLVTGAALLLGYLFARLMLNLPSRADITSPLTGPSYATVPAAILVLSLALRTLFPGFLEDSPLWWAFLAATALGGALSVAFTVTFFVAAFEDADFEAHDISGIWFVPETALLLSGLMCVELAPGSPAGWSRPLTVVGLVFIGAGVVLFGLTAALFVNRLVLHEQRLESGAAAMWIMISPVGVASLALHHASDDAQFLVGVRSGVAGAAELAAVLLWGFSLWWILAAGLLTWHVRTEALSHTPADWGFVFPPAALTIATITLGRQWDSPLVEGIGFGLSLLLLLVWWAVAWATLRPREPVRRP